MICYIIYLQMFLQSLQLFGRITELHLGHLSPKYFLSTFILQVGHVKNSFFVQFNSLSIYITNPKILDNIAPIRNASIHEPNHIDEASLNPLSLYITITAAIQGTNKVSTTRLVQPFVPVLLRQSLFLLIP